MITWWIGTRGKDFMATPSEAKLSQIRQEVERAMPATDQPRDAVSAPNREIITSPSYDPNRKHPLPIINPNDLKIQPKLDEYQSDSKHGPGYLIEMAELLELNWAHQRALLCWERVLDSTKSNDEQSTKAQMAIGKLSTKVPLWNSNPSKQTSIVLNIGTDTNTAKSILPAIQQIAEMMEQSSGGIVKVTINIIAGEPNKNQSGPAPAAAWLSGDKESSKSTKILSFSYNQANPVTEDASATIYQLIQGHLARNAKTLTPPRPLEKTQASTAIQNNITRLSWQKLAQTLNSAE